MRDSWNPKHPHHLEGSPRSIPTISAPQYQEPKVMSFTRALAKRASRQSRFGGARPGTIGLAISPAGTGITSVQQQQRMTRWPGGDGDLTTASATPAKTPAPVVRRYSPEPDTPAVPLAMSPGRAVNSFNFFPQSPPQQQSQSPPSQHQQPQPTPLSPPQPTHQPTRPNLTVAIPPTVTVTKPKRASTASNGNGRDSIVTEFAEDGEDMTTSALGSALIWRPPNTDANSATTYYVADKWGNWVLGGTGSTPPDTDEREPAELETPISKTVAERERQAQAAADVAKENRQRKQVGTDITKDKMVVTDSEAVKAAMRHLSSPTIPESVALRNQGSVASGTGAATIPNNSNSDSNNNTDVALLPPLKPTIRLVTPDSGRLPVNSRSSSIYSNFSMPQQVVPGADNPMPKPDAAIRPPAGTVTVSKRASRVGLPAATRDPAQLGMVHPALRTEPQQQQYIGNNSNNNGARPPMRKGSNSGNNIGFVGGRRDRSQTMMSQDSTTTIASSVGDSDVDVDDFPLPSSSSRQSSYATTQRQSSTQHPIDLSPVIESPGRSPVRYPQIPRSRSSAQMHAAVTKSSVGQQRPVNPAIKKIQNNSGPSSDSPTLGIIGSQRPQMQMGPSSLAPTTTPSEGRISYYQSPPPRRSSLNPERREGLVRSGSPKMAGPDELVVQKQQQRPQYQQQQQQQQERVLSQSSSPSRNNFQQQEGALPHPQSFQTRINNRSQLPSQSHSRYGPSSVYDVYNDPTTTSRPVSQETIIHTTTKPTPAVPSYQAFQKQTPASPPQPFMPSPPSASEATAPQPPYHQRGGAPSPRYNNIISPPPTTPSPTGSASSALLAKRLGPEKAAAFQVPVESVHRKYWARRKSVLPSPQQPQQQQQPSLLPKGVVVRKVVHDPTATPTSATTSRNTSEESNKENRVSGARRGGGGGGGVDYEGEGYENETQYFLPATPGWKPQLTPKRRGDDLYLSVQ